MAKKKASPLPRLRKKYLLHLLYLLLVTFGLYFQVTSHEFVNYDDDTLITKNRVVVDPESRGEHVFLEYFYASFQAPGLIVLAGGIPDFW